MTDIPIYAQRRFVKAFRTLHVSHVYNPAEGWQKLPGRVKFSSAIGQELFDRGVTQVRLRTFRESHDVSIIEAYARGGRSGLDRDVGLKGNE
jgi:hypothetical protein